MVFGWEDKDDGSCWPNAKGYKCLPAQQCVQPTSVVLLNHHDLNYKDVKTTSSEEHGGHRGDSEDPTDAWVGKLIMFKDPSTSDVGYKVTSPMDTTVYGLTGRYDAGATLSWRVIGGDGTWYSNECYDHNGNHESSCNVPSEHGIRGNEFEVKLQTHHSSWNWFGALSFVCSPMPEGAATRWEEQHHDVNDDDKDDDKDDGKDGPTRMDIEWVDCGAEVSGEEVLVTIQDIAHDRDLWTGGEAATFTGEGTASAAINSGYFRMTIDVKDVGENLLDCEGDASQAKTCFLEVSGVMDRHWIGTVGVVGVFLTIFNHCVVCCCLLLCVVCFVLFVCLFCLFCLMLFLLLLKIHDEPTPFAKGSFNGVNFPIPAGKVSGIPSVQVELYDNIPSDAEATLTLRVWTDNTYTQVRVLLFGCLG